MSIGDRIRERREGLGLTLEAVGGALGVHRSTVMRYENGDTQRIPLPVIERLAVILETTPACLMGWDEEMSGETLDPEIRLIARNLQQMPADKRDIFIRVLQTMSDIADEELTKHDRNDKESL